MDQTDSDKHLELVRHHWNELAQQWDEAAQQRPVLDQRWQDWSPSLRSFLPVPDRAIKLLDAGCGPGYQSNLFAHFGFRVKACDLSPVMIEYSQSRSRTLGLAEPVEFEVSSIEQMPYQSEEFNIVHSRLVLDFTPHPAYALKELRRVSKLGGKLILSTLGANSPVKFERWKRFLQGIDSSAEPYNDVLNGITPWEVESLLPVLGWKLLHQEGYYGPSMSGNQNPFNEENMQPQPIVFQQTVCTGWTIVAEAVL